MRWINVLIIFSTFFAYLSPFVNPVNFWQFSFFGLIFPWLLLGNLVFIIFWGLQKKKYFLLSFCCVLLGWGHVKSFVGLNFFGDSTTANPIVIASYNIHALKGLYQGIKNKEIKKKNERDFVEFLKKEGTIHILCTQETSQSSSKFIREHFDFPYHHQLKYKKTALFSKFPILKTGEVSFGLNSNSCIWADVQINQQTVRIYSIHLQSNQVSSTADKVMTEGDLRSKETLKDIKGMMGKYRFFTKRRAAQAQKVANHIALAPHPVIICGDLNDTPQSFSYHILTKNLKDSFKEKGFGLGTTYAGNIPALRIDYILYDKKIKLHNLKILKENFSDHYPVICQISL